MPRNIKGCLCTEIEVGHGKVCIAMFQIILDRNSHLALELEAIILQYEFKLKKYGTWVTVFY
jgi:hypothetical protein